MKLIEDLRPGDTVTALCNGPIAVGGFTYEVSEVRLRDGYVGLTLLKPNRHIPKRDWSSFDVSGNNLSDLFQVDFYEIACARISCPVCGGPEE